MSDSHPCQYDGHTPDHIPTTHGERGYCKVCLEYDYVAETVAVNLGGVHLGLRWKPCPSALEIEARKRLAGLLSAAPTRQPTPSEPAPAAPPAEPTPYAALLAYAADELKGGERKAVEVLCSTNGSLAVADFALAIGWDCFDGGQWSSLQNRLNKKLRKQGWLIERRDNHARLRPYENATEK
jgi:hypothetical protein